MRARVAPGRAEVAVRHAGVVREAERAERDVGAVRREHVPLRLEVALAPARDHVLAPGLAAVQHDDEERVARARGERLAEQRGVRVGAPRVARRQVDAPTVQLTSDGLVVFSAGRGLAAGEQLTIEDALGFLLGARAALGIELLLEEARKGPAWGCGGSRERSLSPRPQTGLLRSEEAQI